MENWLDNGYLLFGGLGVLFVLMLVLVQVPGLWLSTDRFNSTEDWLPPPRHVDLPRTSTADDRARLLLTPCLEEGERLEGFATAFFFPGRPKDWGPQFGLPRFSLVFGVTPRRMIFFELRPYPWTVLRYRSIAYDDIQYLRPPGRDFLRLGLTGHLRFGLHSGQEYQLSFLGPFIFPESMRQELRLVAYLRWLAPRYPSSRPADNPQHGMAASSRGDDPAW